MSTRNPESFEGDPSSLESLEKASIRLVAYCMYNIADLASEEFAKISRGNDGSLADAGGAANLSDKFDYLGEDLTRMAMDAIGLSRVPAGRLFGAIDYKAARIAFLSDFAVEQALLVDSKAEKGSLNVCRVQVTQTSMTVNQSKGGQAVSVPGLVGKVWESGDHNYITTTMFVKYHYEENPSRLQQITVAALPNGYLQDKYNPSEADDIWNVGPDSVMRGEKFRTRLNFKKLEYKARWRVQRIIPGQSWEFQE